VGGRRGAAHVGFASRTLHTKVRGVGRVRHEITNSELTQQPPFPGRLGRQSRANTTPTAPITHKLTSHRKPGAADAMHNTQPALRPPLAPETTWCPAPHLTRRVPPVSRDLRPTPRPPPVLPLNLTFVQSRPSPDCCSPPGHVAMPLSRLQNVKSVKSFSAPPPTLREPVARPSDGHPWCSGQAGASLMTCGR
jgi:hypothetical protein